MRQLCGAVYAAYLKDCRRSGRKPVPRRDESLVEVAWRLRVIADIIGASALPLDDGALALAVAWKEEDAATGGAVTRRVSRLCA